ncbi:hypothetical protein ERHA55_53850 (plasmid) [Erwinia rhapontici]|uniref:Uncharacterized protein n=1 Tax=Erwinia rhapontici TaxID=55212 RepID=A0ABN6DUK4_ERWRD|nr:hypothetical protein [Erwinia rhapontici]BCQ37395.1 hypothetical protein ERHA53_47380 [Erwinia rhapontici]BCQ47858.1 hypothetical protein ERHA55_53850 [Erwinia rhapontici]
MQQYRQQQTATAQAGQTQQHRHTELLNKGEPGEIKKAASAAFGAEWAGFRSGGAMAFYRGRQ